MKDQQVERASRIASLIVKRMQDSLSPQEHAELEQWLSEDSENFLLYEELMDENKLGAELEELQSIDHESAYQRLSDRFFHSTPVLKNNTRRIWYFAAAALLVVSIGAYLVWSQAKPVAATQTTAQNEDHNQTIKPGSKKATLTLADGRTIELDHSKQGIIAEDGNNTIQQSNAGNLYYSEHQKQSFGTGSIPENVLTVPRSGEYSVRLNDGTIVWLNALSTLRFPVTFKGAERRVHLSGEAYFQVAKDAARPFVVDVESVEVRALGTEFNITAYPEDKKVSAALVQGTVSIMRDEEEHVLKPGNTAEIPDGGKIEVREADIEEITAWKNGEFVFHNTPLYNLMNQLARWYDLDVSYPDGIPAINFTGGLQRDDGFFRVINFLELTGEVKFDIEGRKVLVYPNK